MAFHAADLAKLKSAVGTFSNLISATKKNKYGYTPMQFDPTLKAKETLYFTIEDENSITLQAEATDHYLENNEAIQDHVSLAPAQIKCSAFVCEVTTKIDGELGELNDLIEEKLIQISEYLPNVTATAVQILNSLKQALQVAKKAKDAVGQAWDWINGNDDPDAKKTKQQKIFEQFRTYFLERTLFVVNTPWAQYDNCIIESFQAFQGGDSENVTNFSVTFKQLRFVHAYYDVRGGRNATQAGGKKFLGASTPTVAKVSWTERMGKYFSELADAAKSAWG